MKYAFICNAKKTIPKMAKAEDMEEWITLCRDELLHKKCRMIRCYEALAGTPQKMIVMLDTSDPDPLDMLSRDFGKDWSIESYPLHEMQEIGEEDHSIVAG